MAEGKDKAAGTQGAAAPSPEEEIAKLKAEIAKKDQALEKSKELIKEQSERLATKEIQAASKDPVVMINKKHYRFLGKGNLTINGKVFPAEKVKEDQETLKYLIEIKSGLLVEVNTKKGGK